MEQGTTSQRRSSKWRIIKEKLSVKLACCGSPWAGPIHTNHATLIQENSYQDYSSSYFQDSLQHLLHLPNPNSSNPQEVNQDLHCILMHQNSSTRTASTSEEMNLATALANERQFRAAMMIMTSTRITQNQSATTAMVPTTMIMDEETSTTTKMSLLRLLEEKEREEREKSVTNGNVENEELGLGLSCCVCMERNKGAAFIPCGHTFCRVCARELWLNRGACPLCNRPIVEILDIF
ncbi:uncharacterized protein A4U43_C05F31930 [Asparagus officinalis]|uniref:RING-type domain-containing protein n=1 Tax=Asparagus officinalis TaxID=4686 RepID=A0A5P1EXS7_ASPOF|nr:uncharacterized protein A4U43_C05F31930 [Asparagus officinalis]